MRIELLLCGKARSAATTASTGDRRVHRDGAERRVAAYLSPGRIRHGETDPTAGRVLKRKPLMQVMADTIRRAGRRSRYRLRKQVVEPVFGQIK